MFLQLDQQNAVLLNKTLPLLSPLASNAFDFGRF
jgi:hypothetical protein